MKAMCFCSIPFPDGTRPPIEMAIEARKMGVSTIAITNMEYTSQVSSRHKSGKKLYEVCDIVIDNCGDFEDSSMLLPGMNQKIGPTSSVVGLHHRQYDRDPHRGAPAGNGH